MNCAWYALVSGWSAVVTVAPTGVGGTVAAGGGGGGGGGGLDKGGGTVFMLSISFSIYLCLGFL